MKRKWKKILMVVLSIIMVLSVSACSSTDSGDKDQQGADEPISVIIAHTDTTMRSVHKWFLWLGEYLEEEAPGKFAVEVFPDGQLGDSPDLMAGVLLGTITMGAELSPVQAAMIGPDASCQDLPFLYPNYDSWVKGTFENGGLELYRESAKKVGFYCMDMFYNGLRHIISRDGTYPDSKSLAGVKVRVQQNDLNIAMWQALGANPTPMAWGEVITSLSQGQIDALDHTLGTFADFNLQEMAPYITLLGIASSPSPLCVSVEWLENLPTDLRAIFEEGVRLMSEQQRAEEYEIEKGYIKQLEDGGAIIKELTKDETDAFIEAVQPVYDKWREMVGDELVDEWLATVP